MLLPCRRQAAAHVLTWAPAVLVCTVRLMRCACSWNEEDAEREEAEVKADRAAFEELTPHGNLLQSQNAVGQLASEPTCARLHVRAGMPAQSLWAGQRAQRPVSASRPAFILAWPSQMCGRPTRGACALHTQAETSA